MLISAYSGQLHPVPEASKSMLTADVDFQEIASKYLIFVCADLENLLNESCLAARRSKSYCCGISMKQYYAS